LLAILGSTMLKRETIPIADIYVPVKRRATLEQKRVDEIAASILDKGLQAPIRVRADGWSGWIIGANDDFRKYRGQVQKRRGT
jgi:hypothetical protein